MRKKEVLNLVEEVVNYEETAGMLDKAIQHHERMKNSYFWSSPNKAHSRRKYEADNSFRYKIEMTNGYVEIVQNVECSCANVYYRMYINVAHKCTAKYKGFPDPYLKEKLLPMFPGKKTLNKSYYKSLCFGLDKGIEEVQRRVGCGELFFEDMLTIAYMK